MTQNVTLVWLRRDLRLGDQAAFSLAAARGAVVPVYIDSAQAQGRAMGAAQRWWLHHTLASLAQDLARKGAPLLFFTGDPAEILSRLARQLGAQEIMFSRLYDREGRAEEPRVAGRLQKDGVTVRGVNNALLFEPWEIFNKSGAPFKVFTPFSKACFAEANLGTSLPAPRKLTTIPDAARKTKALALDDLKLLPEKPDWSASLAHAWKAGEKAALQQLVSFVDHGLARYEEDRDRPDREGTSRLSAYLALGVIGPRQIWRAVQAKMQAEPACHAGGLCYLKELLWREFSYHLLFQNPDMAEKPLQASFAKFKWQRDPAALHAWQRGQTGYPLVDAGLRQLWQTGWMHNRVRMIVASFLVKDLLLPWQQGEAWFWDTLIDADPASNAASWQWVAGCGADAAPFFRIFNPVTQGEKFDPNGVYVCQYVPELKGIKGRAVHAPWLLPAEALAAAGVRLGRDYPLPLVDHAAARQKALKMLKNMKET